MDDLLGAFESSLSLDPARQDLSALLADAAAVLERAEDASSNSGAELPSRAVESVADWVHNIPSRNLKADDHLTYATACWHATRLKCRAHKPLDNIEKLLEALQELDRDIGLSVWITDHPERCGDDDHDIMHATMPRGVPLDAAKARGIAAVARLSLTIGRAMSEGGNLRHGLHFHVTSIYIYNALRSNASVKAGLFITEREFRELYLYGINQALMLKNVSDLTVELATKLVSIHEVAIAEAVTSTQVHHPSTAAMPIVEPDAHFAAQEALGRALLAAGDIKPAYQAFFRALELMDVEWPFAESARKLQPSPNQILGILVSLTTCGMTIMRPASECLIHARAAVQITRQLQKQKPAGTTKCDLATVKLLHAVAVLTYRYALDVAGGPETASSPPVAIAVPGMERKGTLPAVRELVEEACACLKEALDGAPASDEKYGKRAIALQLAIVHLELREESAAHLVLLNNTLDRPLIIDLDNRRRNVESSSETSSLVAPFVNTVYSSAVLKRLLSIAPGPQSADVSQASTKRPRVLLSRKSRANLRVQCTYCCMTSVSEPLRCEICAVNNIFIWYCGEECFHAHAMVHEKECVGTRGTWAEVNPFFGGRF